MLALSKYIYIYIYFKAPAILTTWCVVTGHSSFGSTITSAAAIVANEELSENVSRSRIRTSYNNKEELHNANIKHINLPGTHVLKDMPDINNICSYYLLLVLFETSKYTNVNHSRIHPFNQPVLNNESKVSCSSNNGNLRWGSNYRLMTTMVIQSNALNEIYAANYDDSTCGAEMFMYLYKHQ